MLPTIVNILYYIYLPKKNKKNKFMLGQSFIISVFYMNMYGTVYACIFLVYKIEQDE